MAALPIAAAAVLGYLGASSTSFVQLPGTVQTPVAAPAAGASAARAAAQPGSATGTFCASVAVGVAAAAAARASRSRVSRKGFLAEDLTTSDNLRNKPFAETWGVPYKSTITPPLQLDTVFEDEVISFKPRVIENFAGGLVGAESAWATQMPYDPMDFAGMYPEHVPWYREAELKHGRVAMLGMIGLIAQDTFRIPGLEDPSITILNSHKELIYGIGQGPMWVLLVFCSLIESQRFKDLGLNFDKLTHENAGDLNFGKQFLPKTEEGIKQLKLKELKNGRLAMLAFSGAITQAAFFGKTSFPWY